MRYLRKRDASRLPGIVGGTLADRPAVSGCWSLLRRSTASVAAMSRDRQLSRCRTCFLAAAAYRKGVSFSPQHARTGPVSGLLVLSHGARRPRVNLSARLDSTGDSTPTS